MTRLNFDSDSNNTLVVSFPDIGGRRNLPGILFGVPPHVSYSDVLKENDNAYHIEAFYRWRVNDNISVTPGLWVILNPENNSNNDTQYVGVVRTTLRFLICSIIDLLKTGVKTQSFSVF
ncbi:iron uptake porin [Nostocaceae cyanobacterium CENA357]|uniref:Iron uptake porin n=1 Tax=Atlanticothrix silvestris CENA357 TaxID=1725252 RepID=A0A8J7L730_9CYAN|nr:iron uptake porin [Atlanticothrix silvestris]MBH8554722.1 iron uptake porin [Atlanticothrix silvestris CENA357]